MKINDIHILSYIYLLNMTMFLSKRPEGEELRVPRPLRGINSYLMIERVTCCAPVPLGFNPPDVSEKSCSCTSGTMPFECTATPKKDSVFISFPGWRRGISQTFPDVHFFVCFRGLLQIVKYSSCSR